MEKRLAIYDHFHSSEKLQKFLFARKDRYAAYYTSMFLIADTAESIFTHMEKGFSPSLISYIEFWGVMQGLIIQQDAICELYHAVTTRAYDCSVHLHWTEIRAKRNVLAGHPALKNQRSPRTRSFMGRNFGHYGDIAYERWDVDKQETDFPHFDLRRLITGYDKEAASVLDDVLKALALL
jgi:hypothetical protein